MPLETTRQRMIRLLKDTSYSSHELAAAVDISERDVEDHLSHIVKSIQQSLTNKFHVYSASCRNCLFIFHTRNRLSSPSRCPKCKKEGIIPPRFKIIEKRKAAHGEILIASKKKARPSILE